ncbi:MAG: hypothetical protein LIO86_06810 [Lachnospiraceae bacterium]|nr:hypothetical protein [Lachnospiraceae bacterium]MCD8250424.1 hypothetical protein [Lachnospiraceae bacterium]MCD8363392.1 hypothetical protein [Lachnospiraceae bacterium]
MNCKEHTEKYDDLSTCSARDMTGLIPAGIENEEEWEHYEELFPFLPKVDKKHPVDDGGWPADRFQQHT